MKQFIVLLAVLGLCLALPTKHVENTNGTIFYHPTVGGRIVGGVATTINQIPWQVAILRNGAQLCGGILVAPRIVLTAAHCIVPSLIPLLSGLNVRTGSTTHNNGGLRITATSRVIHALYQDCEFCSPDYDIGVVNLAANGNVAPAAIIGLWDANTVFNAGVVGTVSGWGATCELVCPGTVTLRSVDVPVVGNVQCRNVYGSIITTRTICAGLAAGGKDSCQGDSGGPYVINGRLAGIVSFGSGCARAGLPGVYASIPGYRAWITTNTGL